MSKNIEKKVFKEVNDIYSYILTPIQIKKLTNQIFNTIKNEKYNKPKRINQKDILLITYADTIKSKNKKSLVVLEDFLNKFIKKTINTIHILPFYPSSSDGGFSVKDFFKVDKQHGSWKSIKSISNRYKLMIDVVLNHGSSQSNWFKNFLKTKGEGKDFFYSLDKEINTSHIVRARSHKLLQKFKTKKGYKYLWCTFSRDQIDFDYRNPKVLLMFIKIIKFIMKQGPSIFRLDAVAFLWKRIESNCVNLDQTHAIIRLLRIILSYNKNKCMIVTETNLPFLENFSYFGRSDEAHIIYNFSLAPLIINTLIKSNSSAFRRWSMSMPPAKDNNCYLNFLATHDGIGLRPLEGIISKNNIRKLIAPLKSFGAKFTYRKDKDNQLSVYEANISLIDAMSGTINGKDNFTYDRFFCAHAIMLCFEGIPSFYIHSLFGTRNDYELLKSTKIFRSINRHIYDYDYLKKEIYDLNSHISKVYNQIIKLIEVRKKQRAFHPNATQYTLNISNNFFGLWRQSIDRKQSIFAISNVTNKKQVLSLDNINLLSMEKWYDLLSLKEINIDDKNLTFKPYQSFWIANKKN